MSDERTVKISDDNFKQEVLESPIPVIVDFWAPWCGPCRMIAPVLDEIAVEYDGKVRIGKYNVDEQTQFASEHGIRGIPALLLFKDGKLADTIVGAVPKSAIVDKLQAVLASS